MSTTNCALANQVGSIGVRNDTWITSRCGPICWAQNFDSAKVKVVTENGGCSSWVWSPARKDQAVNIARHVSGVKQVIKAFEFAQN